MHPRDFGALAQYQEEIQKVPSRYPLPGKMSLQQFGEFVVGSTGHAVEWQGLG